MHKQLYDLLKNSKFLFQNNQETKLYPVSYNILCFINNFIYTTLTALNSSCDLTFPLS